MVEEHESGWVTVDGAAEPADDLPLDDLDLLSEVTHPVRGAILRRLRRPKSVSELAGLFDVPKTRLYHHVNRLEELGFIRVVATRQVGARTERRYQIVARRFSIADGLIDDLDQREFAAAIGSLFDVAKIGLQREIEAGRWSELEERSTLSLGELHLSPVRHAELREHLRELFSRFESDVEEGDGERVVLFVASYPETDDA